MTDFAVLRQRMVDNQLRPNQVTDRDVIRAFLAVPREAFAAPAEAAFAYADRDLAMAEAAPSRRMMEPVRLARLVNALPLGPDAKVMVVGCGTGYSAAILSHLAGSVVAVEEDKALAALAREKLKAAGAIQRRSGRGKTDRGLPPRRALRCDPCRRRGRDDARRSRRTAEARGHSGDDRARRPAESRDALRASRRGGYEMASLRRLGNASPRI